MADDQVPDAITADREDPDEAAGANRLVSRLSWVVLLEWLGAGAVLPLLPLYLRQHGMSSGFVGFTMASFYFAGLVVQFPAGRLTDRIGRRPILIAGLLAYGLASLGYLLPTTPGLFLALRFIQGGAAGAVEVAALALVSSAIPISRRGRATSRIYSGQFIGIFIGPVLGALVGVKHMGVLFAGTAALCTLAAIPVLTSSVIKVHDQVRIERHVALEKIIVGPVMIGAILAGVALGLATGVYEACWSLLMDLRGASQLQIGLSWTVFSLPYIFLIRAGGWMADHRDRRVLVIGGLLVMLGMHLIWPHIYIVNLMIVLNIIEAVGFSLVIPSIQSLLTEGRDPGELGRIQGVYATTSTASIAVSATVAGVLFGIAPWIPFTLAATLGVGIVIALSVLWRNAPGKVDPTMAAPGAGAR